MTTAQSPGPTASISELEDSPDADIIVERIRSRADLQRFIAADRRNLHIDRWRLHHRVRRPEAEFQRQLRIAEYWTNVGSGRHGRYIAYLTRWRARRTGQRLGFSIPPNVFGPGLSIAHVGTIVVNPDAVVGANCRIAHVVTLGEANGRAPMIGRDVHISPHVAVIGASVGDGCGLLTGAVVTKDVPAFSDVGGVPARVLRTQPGRDPWWKGWIV